MKRIVLLRHGESVWNKENRFTGWTDVDLTENGVEEAKRAGRMMSEAGLSFGMAFTSYLKRAVKTLNYALDMMNLDWIPVEKSWQLNEKHYGILQGLNKKETARKYGSEQVFLWRRSYDVAPDPLPDNDPRNPRFDVRYSEVPAGMLPRTDRWRIPWSVSYLLGELHSRFARPVRPGAGGGPRQFAPGDSENTEGNIRRGYREPQSADRDSLCIRIRRCIAPAPRLFPRR